jgi:hypothetical protein
MGEVVAVAVLELNAAAAVEVAQTPKRAGSLAVRPRSLPSQKGSGGGTGFGRVGDGGSATLSSGGLGPAVFGSSATGGTVTVSGTAIGGRGGSGRFGGFGASVSLITNGGVNDAIGGATSGTLNLTQTAIGGAGGTVSSVFVGGTGGNASSILTGTNPFGSSICNLNANATGGPESSFGGPGNGTDVGGSATARADASAAKSGIANATAHANGGGAPIGFAAGAATADASAANGGSAVAQATGGQLEGAPFPVINGPANATAISTAMLGGTANATATATGRTVFANGPGVPPITTNANSFAATINGNMAQALSSVSTFGGQAQATAQTNFGNFQSVQSTSTSPAFGAASAIAQAGGIVSLSNPIIPGQSFSVVSGSGFGPLTVANGSMGAGYGGNGSPLTYQESVSFTQNAGAFVLDLLSSDALGKGFDSALFEILVNSIVFDSQSFTDLGSAEAFFSNNLIGIPLLAGLNGVQLQFSETMSGTEGFSFDYAVA